jgi:hypothetical protein
MLQDHTTARAMTTRYRAGRPAGRRERMVRPPRRRPERHRRTRPSIRPAESA